LVAGLDNNFLGNNGLIAVRHWSVLDGSGHLLDGSVDRVNLLLGSQHLGSGDGDSLVGDRQTGNLGSDHMDSGLSEMDGGLSNMDGGLADSETN
jgi:hypothetical protein